MTNVHKVLGVRNKPDPIFKKIHHRYETKNLTKEQIKRCKMTEREIFEKYDNLNEDELSEKCNKNVYFKK